MIDRGCKVIEVLGADRVGRELIFVATKEERFCLYWITRVVKGKRRVLAPLFFLRGSCYSCQRNKVPTGIRDFQDFALERMGFSVENLAHPFYALYYTLIAILVNSPLRLQTRL